MAHQNGDIEFKIARMLQENGRLPNTEIAKRLGVSEATVRNRLQRLIQEERIQVVAIVNPLRIQRGILGNMRICAQNNKIKQVGQALEKLEELWYIAQLEGTAHFDAEYFIESQKNFGPLVDRVQGIDGITKVDTSLIVRYLKNNWGFGIPSKS